MSIDHKSSGQRSLARQSAAHVSTEDASAGDASADGVSSAKLSIGEVSTAGDDAEETPRSCMRLKAATLHAPTRRPEPVRLTVIEPPQQRNRNHRKRPVRARTINVQRMARSELEVGRLLQPELDYERPATRADCVDGPRPCPFVSCSHHLYLDVSIRTGSIKMNFPDLDVWELEETCALDVADRGRHSDSSLAEILNLTREGVRRLEKRAMERAQLLLRRWNGD